MENTVVVVVVVIVAGVRIRILEEAEELQVEEDELVVVVEAAVEAVAIESSVTTMVLHPTNKTKNSNLLRETKPTRRIIRNSRRLRELEFQSQ